MINASVFVVSRHGQTVRNVFANMEEVLRYAQNNRRDRIHVYSATLTDLGEFTTKTELVPVLKTAAPQTTQDRATKQMIQDDDDSLD